MDTTYVEFIDQIAYLLRYSKNGPVHLIYKYCKHRIDRIYKKPVYELTDEERVILLVHWVYESIGKDSYKETPFSIIENITDKELVKEFNRRCKDPSSDVKIQAEGIY